MKLLLLFLLSVMTVNLSAQSWRYRKNGMTDYDLKRNGITDYDIKRARTTEENNRRVVRQSLQRYEQQERARQQRREVQQRNRGNADDSRTTTIVPSEADNATQSNDKVVSLVVNGMGTSEKEATQNALRSAIEQAFGTFVSANTEVLNDELVKDEIVTVSTGNIKSYNVLSSSQSSSGLYDVSVQATVSIDQLTKFAQSKGMQTELSGASFVMNMKMRELNKKNEIEAINHLMEKSKIIAKKGLLDYELQTPDDQVQVVGDKYRIMVKIIFHENENTKTFYNTIYNTLKSLSLSEIEVNEYRNAHIPYYEYNLEQFAPINTELYKKGPFIYLRNDYPTFEAISNGYYHYNVSPIMPLLITYVTDYIISDNLGNQIYCNVYDHPEKNLFWYYENKKTGKSYYFCLDSKNSTDINRLSTCQISNTSTIVDYGYPGFGGLSLNFNPISISSHNDKSIVDKRKSSGSFFYQQFYLTYSEDEFFKFKSIKIKHRNE